MPKTKILSGKDVIKILKKQGFQIIHQRGSHIKLRRIIHNKKQTLIIPNHKTMGSGTLRAIFKQAANHIPEDLIYSEFFV